MEAAKDTQHMSPGKNTSRLQCATYAGPKAPHLVTLGTHEAAPVLAPVRTPFAGDNWALGTFCQLYHYAMDPPPCLLACLLVTYWATE